MRSLGAGGFIHIKASEVRPRDPGSEPVAAADDCGLGLSELGGFEIEAGGLVHVLIKQPQDSRSRQGNSEQSGLNCDTVADWLAGGRFRFPNEVGRLPARGLLRL